MAPGPAVEQGVAGEQRRRPRAGTGRPTRASGPACGSTRNLGAGRPRCAARRRGASTGCRRGGWPSTACRRRDAAAPVRAACVASSGATVTWSSWPWVTHDRHDTCRPRDRLDDRAGVVRGVDDDDLVVVADHPDVVVDVPGAAVEAERARGDDAWSIAQARPAHSTTTERSTSPSCILSNASSTSSSAIVSVTNAPAAAGPAGRGRPASGSRARAGSRRTRTTSASRRGRRSRSAASRASCPGSARRPARRCRPGRGRRTPASRSPGGRPRR